MRERPSVDEVCEMVRGMSEAEIEEVWNMPAFQHVLRKYIKGRGGLYEV